MYYLIGRLTERFYLVYMVIVRFHRCQILLLSEFFILLYFFEPAFYSDLPRGIFLLSETGVSSVLADYSALGFE